MKGTHPGFRLFWVQIPTLPLSGCVDLEKLANISLPQFLICKMRERVFEVNSEDA